MTGKRSVLLSLSRLCGRVCIILLIAAGFVEHQLRVVHHGLLFTPNSEAETGVLWTMAIAARAQAAWTNRHDHLTQLTSDWLTMMRCRRASRAFSSAVAISRCAVFWPSVSGVRARVMCMNGPKATSALSPFDSQLRTLVGAAHRSHSCHNRP
jgi:hypothetical protein